MLKKIGFGAGLWAIIFIGISALRVTPLPYSIYRILSIVVAMAGAFILGYLYFKEKPGDFKQGLVLGLLWFAVGTVLDLLVTIQYIKAEIGGGYIDGLKVFYGDWILWVSFILTILAVGASTLVTHGGKLMVRPNSQPTATPTPQPPQKPPIINR